jgi:hypothetical protein
MGRKSREKQERRERERNHSLLEHHHRSGKQLTPPMLAIPNLQLASWSDDRLPEMLWAALLVTTLGREAALNIFRGVAASARKLEAMGVTAEATLSGIALLTDEARGHVFDVLRRSRGAINALRPLLLFEKLPAREAWQAIIPTDPEAEDWGAVVEAVARCFDHQSQEATDCRWVRTMFVILNGKLYFQEGMKDLGEEFFRYPDKGDLRKVRPFIRAIEGSLSSFPGAGNTQWSTDFWAQCLRDTGCVPISLTDDPMPAVGTSVEVVRAIQERLQAFSMEVRGSTKVDARLEGTFGLAAYALNLLAEVLRIGNSTSILGRIALRALLEVYVTLSYLVTKDDEDLWLEYRRYGSGQAKLAFLKLEGDGGKLPESINVGLLESLASEDRWLELVSINLGNWGKSNLRRMSEDGGTKPAYDRFYDWTSAFVHGNWAAVRNSMYDLCGNPLHRYHRILRRDAREQEDVVADATDLCEEVLKLVSKAFPSFDASLVDTSSAQ